MLAVVPAWTPVDLLPGLWFALLAVLSIAALRRWFDRPSWRFVLISAVLIGAFFGDVLIAGKVLLPLDNLRGHAPFRQLPPTEPHGNILQGDPLQLVAPALFEVRASYEAGRWPLWRDREGAGMPLAADPQAQALQPLTLLALAVSATSAQAILAALRVWLALLFTFLWLRRLGARESAAAAGALAFGLGGFLQHWLTWPLANTAAWLPVALYALSRLDASGLERQTQSRPHRMRRRDLGLLVLALVGLLLAGHPETIVLALAVLVIDVAARVVSLESNRRRFISAIIGTVVVAAALTAPVLIPTLEYLPQTLRWERGLHTDEPVATPGEESPRPDVEVHPATRLVQTVAPNAFGNDRFVHYWGRDNVNEDASGFVGTVVLLIVLATALIRFQRGWQPVMRHEGLALVGVGLTITLLALPFGFSGRLALVGNLAFALLAAAGVERFVRATGSNRSLALKPWAVALAGLALLVAHLYAYRTFKAPDDPGALDVLRWGWVHWHLRFLAVGTLILTIGQLGRLERPRFLAGVRRIWTLLPIRALGAWALAVLVAAELFIAFREVNPPMPKRLLFPQTPELASLIDATDNAPGLRFTGVGRAMPPNIASIYGLNDVRTFNPMAPADYLAVLAPVLDGWNGEAPSVANADHSVFDLLGVRALLVAVEEGCAEGLAPVGHEIREEGSTATARPDALLCRRDAALERLFLPAGARYTSRARTEIWSEFDPRQATLVEAREVSEEVGRPVWRQAGTGDLSIDWSTATPERLEARLATEEPRWLASSIVQDGGWRLLVDGRNTPTTKTNGAFVGAWIEAIETPDDRRVTLLYRPPGWLVGWWLAAVGLAAASARLGRPVGRKPSQRPRASASA